MSRMLEVYLHSQTSSWCSASLKKGRTLPTAAQEMAAHINRSRRIHNRFSLLLAVYQGNAIG
jgi:hypothetical protein